MTIAFPSITAVVSALVFTSGVLSGQSTDTPPLPTVPADLRVTLFAREPLVRNPCAMAFDARGRLFVGYGPQYRNPLPDTPGDSIAILVDSDGDGTADTAKIFATGLNCVQGMAWRGRDLWVGNSPDLTILRDLDGDDVADEYVKVFTDLGNIEHANHGHNWAPDGKLYFSQGTSKGLTQPGRVAPEPFRELWDVRSKTGDLRTTPLQVFTRATYRATYQDPKDDWGREGGVFRCDDLGANLEIVSRGMRNPWDIAFDSGFNWLGTDNDQSEGDRVIMPFFGAHFGWGHRWSANWTGRGHLPTAPMSGPVFDGSGAGIVYYDTPYLPPAYQGVWLFNDWLRKITFVYRPRWEGALLQPEGGRWEPLIRGGGAGRAVSSYGGKDTSNAAPETSLYRPVDLVIGPDGALYVSGWGKELGVVWNGTEQANEGRIFRIFWPDAPSSNWNTAKRNRPLALWSFDELLEDLGGLLPVWSTDSQEELVRRGDASKTPLIEALSTRELPEAQQTWALWTLGRLDPSDPSIDKWLAVKGRTLSVNAEIQSIRIAAHRIRESRRETPLPDFALEALRSSEPRIRFAAVQAMEQSRQKKAISRLLECMQTETDRIVYYSSWQALREVMDTAGLRALLQDARSGVRRGALLALLEDRALEAPDVQKFVQDNDAATAEIAANWIAKSQGNPLIDIFPQPGDFVGTVTVKMTPGVKPATVRFTLDGTEPTSSSLSGSPGSLSKTTTLKAALFVNGQKVGNTLVGVYRKREANLAPVSLGEVTKPTTVDDVHALLATADPKRGQQWFAAAGCYACHRVGDEGRAVGPNLTNMGERDDVDSVIRSILDPNRIVVEGYSLLTVSTRDGNGYAGVYESETDQRLNLVQLNGEAVAIDKSTITQRQSSHRSPMPPYDQSLTPSHVADIVTWLMGRRGETPDRPMTTPFGRNGLSESNASGFSWELKTDRISFLVGGKQLGDYVFTDAQTLRPHFQNIKAPSGVQLTRTHPPAPSDPSDHATMHPGVWLAFGDINGMDFWRNKGRIEHVAFTQLPEVKEGRISFASKNRFVGSDGAVMGEQISRFTLRPEGASGVFLTWEATIYSAERDLVFGDQEEMGLGVRLATPLIEKAGGVVVNSDGLRGAKVVWGKQAAWAAYSREVDGRQQGIAVFPDGNNPRVSWWHSRDYGLLVANGFGARSVPDAQLAPLTVKHGEKLTLRYGVLFFDAPISSQTNLQTFARLWQAE